jgi:hypothetical protein
VIAVRFLEKSGVFRKGNTYRVDPASAASLVERGVAVLVDEDADKFDPSAHDVKAVNDYLRDASPAERHRVLAAERAGKARTTVLGG